MSIISMIGNPWNPMPGWLHPGLADDSAAPLLMPYNRGAFDAVGLPYCFGGIVGGSTTSPVESYQVFRRRLDTYQGFSGELLYMWRLLLVAAFGEDRGTDAYATFLRTYFVHDRNVIHPELVNFWSASPQSYVWFQSSSWNLVCNANIPPGLDNPEPPEIDPSYKDFGGWPILGDSSKRWSLFPRTAPDYDVFGQPETYTLYQTYEDAVPFEFGTADTFRAGVFPFPFLQLHCMSRDDFGAIIRLYPVNP
jgi:hypothetical protein